MNFTTTRRWSDNDFRFGPFVWSRDTVKRFGVILDSGDPESPGCHLRFYLGTGTLLLDLPPIIRPWRQRVAPTSYGWAHGPGYWDEHPREYGFSIVEGFLQVRFGRQTHDSDTEQSWSYFFPWTQWQFVRFSLYDLSGRHFWTELESNRKAGVSLTDCSREEAVASCPSVVFSFRDFDGELLTATTHIEEREWQFGTGAFKWLRWFRAPKIKRELDIRFSGETGPRKGSWKGGTVGCSIELLPGELHQAAFKRYCAEHQILFVGDPIETETSS